MTSRKARFTESDVRRMIRAATREGLRVVGITVDGTLILDDSKGSNPLLPAPVDDEFIKWEREHEARKKSGKT